MKIETASELTQFINKLEIKILNNGYANIDKDWNHGLIKSAYSRIYVTVDGEGEVIDSQNSVIKLKPGEICFIPAGAYFRYQCDAYMEQIYFHVSYIKPNGLDVFDDYDKIHIIKSPLKAEDITKERFLQNNLSTAMRYMSLIGHVASEVIENSYLKKQSSMSYSPVIEKTVRRICEEKSLKLTLSQVSKDLFVSESMLSRKFKKELGVTFSEYVEKIVFSNAIRDLSTGEYTIKEISASYGFCDEFYFSRRFKKLYGITPSSYKKLTAKYLPC